MRREIFKWKHVVSRQANDSSWIDCAGEFASGFQKWLEGFGRLVVGHDDDHRLPGCPRHQRDVKRTRSRSQSGHTPAPRTQAQVPANAFKSRGVLQLRENFADKRENHLSLV